MFPKYNAPAHIFESLPILFPLPDFLPVLITKGNTFSLSQSGPNGLLSAWLPSSPFQQCNTHLPLSCLS